MGKRQYSENDKAAALLALQSNGGNLKRTSEETKIPLMTIRNWRDGKGTNDEVTNISNEKRPELVDRLMTELNAILDLMPEKRADASYGDLTRGAGIMVDKVRLLSGESTANVSVTWGKLLTEDSDDSSDPFA